jgi:hypothetical protein
MAHTRGMARPPLRIDIPKKDRQDLRKPMKGGLQQVRVVLRALQDAHCGKGSSIVDRSEAISVLTTGLKRDQGGRS